jgi:hypothetical protein
VSGAADLYAIVELDEDYGPRATGYSSNDSLFKDLGEAYEELVLTRGEAARNGKEGRFVLASVVLVPEDAEAIDRAARGTPLRFGAVSVMTRQNDREAGRCDYRSAAGFRCHRGTGHDGGHKAYPIEWDLPADLADVLRDQSVVVPQDGNVYEAIGARERWHVVHNERLMQLLRRAHQGEDPDLLYIEEYVNAERETVDGEDAS